MKAPAQKQQAPLHKKVPQNPSPKTSESAATFQFADNRQEAVAQKELQIKADKNSRVRQLKSFQAMANNSQQVRQTTQLQQQANIYSGQQVQPITQLKQTAVPKEGSLEKEADSTEGESLGETTDSKTLQKKSISGEKVAQLVPTQNAEEQWVDTDVNDHTYDTFYALAQAHIATYRTYNGAALKGLLALFKQHLTPAQLRGLINDNFKTTIVDENATLHIRTIRMPTITQAQVNTMVQAAENIFNNFNIAINVASQVAITAAELGAGITGVDDQGRYARGTAAADDWALIGRYMNGNELPVLFVPDVTGFGFFGKPSGITLRLHNAVEGRTLVLMRSGQSGQTLAHELGHAMGGNYGGIQHGEHVNAATEFNLMHGDPIIGSLHTSLRREQVAAFKGSRFVT